MPQLFFPRDFERRGIYRNRKQISPKEYSFTFHRGGSMSGAAAGGIYMLITSFLRTHGIELTPLGMVLLFGGLILVGGIINAARGSGSKS
jgi:hypothetical protein